MIARRILIAVLVGALLATTAAAGFVVGENRTADSQRSAIVHRLSLRLRAGDEQGARRVLQEAVSSGAIRGALLQTRGPHVTGVGNAEAAGSPIRLPHGARVSLAGQDPLAAASRIEALLAGLLVTLALGLAAGLVVLWLLPRLLRPVSLPRRARPAAAVAPSLDAEYLARHDALTGLPNRVLLKEEAQTRIMRLHGDTLALILIDLNEFKEVNDTLGHFAGDQLLRQAGERLTGSPGTARWWPAWAATSSRSCCRPRAPSRPSSWPAAARRSASRSVVGD